MRKLMASLFALVMVLGLGFGPRPALALSLPTTTAGMQCPDAGFWNELIGGVCWSSMFPIMISGGTAISGGNPAPNDAYTGSFACTCKGNVSNAQLPRDGIPIGYWQPSMLIEVVPAPFCMPVLGGVYAGGSGLNGVLFSGSRGTTGIPGETAGEAGGYWNVHQWTYPLVTMLNMLNIPNCGTGYNGMNLLDFSEVQPQWNDDLTAELIWPESAVLSGPIGTFGAVGECISELPPFKNQPMDSMYWTAGCWGLLFPPSGNIAYAGQDPIVASNLEAARFLSTEYRLGNGVQTMGKASLCGPLYANILPKEQFRWQMVFPNNESSSVPNNIPGTGGPTSTASMPTSMAQPTISADQVDTIISPSQTNSALQQIANGSTCTHWTGQSPLTWGEWLGQPGTGGNYVYLVFQWTDCCMGLIGGSLQ